MNKIITVSIDDIIIDPGNISEMITHACSSRSVKMHVTGICSCGDIIIISLEENISGQCKEYVFAPFESENCDAVAAEINTRYFAGFSLVGGFDIKNRKWALFSKNKD